MTDPTPDLRITPDGTDTEAQQQDLIGALAGVNDGLIVVRVNDTGGANDVAVTCTLPPDLAIRFLRGAMQKIKREMKRCVTP